MFQALLEEIKDHSGASQTDAWMLSSKELSFKGYRKASTNAAGIPAPNCVLQVKGCRGVESISSAREIVCRVRWFLTILEEDSRLH